MCGEKAGELCEGGFRTVDDESHEQQGKRQVLRVESNDEEGHLTRWVILGEGVCVCESEGREKRVGVEDDSSCCDDEASYEHRVHEEIAGLRKMA